MPTLRTVSIGLLALLFIAGGINHFRDPAAYLSMMPPWLPAHDTVNVVSGVAEIAGGIGLLIPPLRRAAAWGLIALLVAVFPANVHVALHGWPGADLPAWLLWARLPVQPLLIAWVWWAALKRGALKREVAKSPTASGPLHVV